MVSPKTQPRSGLQAQRLCGHSLGRHITILMSSYRALAASTALLANLHASPTSTFVASFALSSSLGFLGLSRQKAYFEHQSARILAKMELTHTKDQEKLRQDTDDAAAKSRYDLQLAQNQCEDLRAKIKHLESSINGDSDKQNETLHAAQAEVERLAAQLEARQTEHNNLQQQLQSTREEHQNALASLRKQLDLQHAEKTEDFMQQLAALQSERDSNHASHNQVSAKLQTLQTDHADIVARSTEAQNQLLAAVQAKEKLQKDVEDLHATLTQDREHLANEKEAAGQAQQKVIQLETDLASLVSR